MQIELTWRVYREDALPVADLGYAFSFGVWLNCWQSHISVNYS